MRITFQEYETMLDVFDAMSFKANDYVPPDRLLDGQILPALEEGGESLELFLAWIEETGRDTPANRKARSRIRRIVKDRLEVV